ncbi:MAG: HIT domain-containing protein [Actinomycetota bacterium]|nr:HIT domain-containing protein [Actinomycetota bacterium]
MEYMSTAGEHNPSGCIFCDHLTQGDDAAANILYRGEHVFAILNAFPYNTGHLMVAPLRHVADVSDLDVAERGELFELTCRAVDIVRDAMGAQGFNTGMNLGAAGGAGIPGHLHMHVVPRWGGDTNFMTVTGNTKVLPEMLADTYAKLKPAFDALS